MDVLRFVVEYVRRETIPPTLREIMDAIGIRATNAVDEHLHALEKRGCVKRTQLVSRGIQVTDRGRAYARGYDVVAGERCLGCSREIFGDLAVARHVCLPEDLAVAS